jgi:large subunit ribosomal protein L23
VTIGQELHQQTFRPRSFHLPVSDSHSAVMVRVFFPSMFMRLISWKPNKTPPQALLHVQPSMTKHEITEYLTKIYDVDVTKVMTANFLGK